MIITNNPEIIAFLKNIAESPCKGIDPHIQILGGTSESPIVFHERTDQVTFVLRGTGYFFNGKDFWDIGEGDIVLIAKGERHGFAATSGSLTLFHIHMPYEYLENDRFVVNHEDVITDTSRG